MFTIVVVYYFYFGLKAITWSNVDFSTLVQVMAWLSLQGFCYTHQIQLPHEEVWKISISMSQGPINQYWIKPMIIWLLSYWLYQFCLWRVGCGSAIQHEMSPCQQASLFLPDIAVALCHVLLLRYLLLQEEAIINLWWLCSLCLLVILYITHKALFFISVFQWEACISCNKNPLYQQFTIDLLQKIPQCTSSISHNAPFCNRNVCTFLL